jgi:hypothetical protein
MRIQGLVCAIIAFVIIVCSAGLAPAQDNAAEIAALQGQIERLKNIMNLGAQEMDRVGGQGIQNLGQQITNWESQLSNIDTQISRLDEQIMNASEQQRAGLTQGLNNILRQKAGAEAFLLRLRNQYQSELEKLNEEKAQLAGKFDQGINALNKQLDKLIQVKCCINGECAQKSRADCVSSGGTEVADCDQQCVKINCCKAGTVTQVSRAECASAGGKEVNYPAYECEIFKCKTKAGQCVDLTRGECEKDGGVVGTKTECSEVTSQ